MQNSEELPVNGERFKIELKSPDILCYFDRYQFHKFYFINLLPLWAWSLTKSGSTSKPKRICQKEEVLGYKRTFDGQERQKTPSTRARAHNRGKELKTSAQIKKREGELHDTKYMKHSSVSGFYKLQETDEPFFWTLIK